MIRLRKPAITCTQTVMRAYRPTGQIKRAIFSQRTHNNNVSYLNSQVYPDFTAMKHNLFDKNDHNHNDLLYHCGQV